MKLIFLLFGYTPVFLLLSTYLHWVLDFRFCFFLPLTIKRARALSLFLSFCQFISICIPLSHLFHPFSFTPLSHSPSPSFYQTHIIAHAYRFHFKKRYVYCIMCETKAPAWRYPKYQTFPSIQIRTWSKVGICWSCSCSYTPVSPYRLCWHLVGR